jgi:hypothetical protein
MKTRVLIITLLAFLASLFYAGCEQIESIKDINNDAPGKLIVKITDAPFPIDMVEEANVIITKVEIRSAADTSGSEVDSAGYPFITIFEGSEKFNLMDLRNGVTADLVDVEIPAGDYDHIRIYVDSATITLKDYGTFDAKVPSGAQTGIKLFIEPSLKVAGGLTAEVLLDFCLDKSFVMQGNMNTPAGIKGFIFKPVIRAVNNTESGTIQGVVTGSDSILLENAEVWIELEQDTVTSYTDSTGFYAMAGIPSGSYTMGAAMAGFDTLIVDDVAVIEGNWNIQDFNLEADTASVVK